jgi:hypothetical protein
MDVQLASELDPAAEAGRLTQWAASYRTSGGTGSWLAPRREAGEQWHAVIRGVVRVDMDRGDLADPGRLSHHRAVPPVPHAWVSPQRVIIGHGRRVLEAWPLDELFGVRVLDDLTGVVLLATEPHPYDDDRIPALLSDIVPWYSKWSGQPPPGYGRRRVDVDWLKFEAVFAARRDQLDEWTRDLPSRLSRIVRQAQDAPAR